MLSKQGKASIYNYMNYHKNLKIQVEHCLKEYPYTRNCDVALTIRLWKIYYRSFISINERGVEFIRVQDLHDLPREDNIKRHRARFQNHSTNPKYLPDDYFVRKKRKISEETWRKHLGYDPEFRTI